MDKRLEFLTDCLNKETPKQHRSDALISDCSCTYAEAATFLLKYATSNTQKATGWYAFGRQMKLREVGSAENQAVTRSMCFFNAVQLDKENANYWYWLGRSIGNAAPFIFEGEPINRRRCVVNALQLDKSHFEAWCLLASTMTHNEVVFQTVYDEGKVKMECIIESLRYNPDYYVAWNSLGMFLLDGPMEMSCVLCRCPHPVVFSTVQIFGQTWTAKMCFIRALVINTEDGTNWNNLGSLMHDDETITINKDYVGMTKIKCFAQALHCSQEGFSHSLAWSNMGLFLKSTNNLVVLHGVEKTAQECYKEALAIDTNIVETWFGVASLIVDGSKLEINNKSMSKFDCVAKGLECNPVRHGGWEFLLDLLEK